jgi:restriction system protein
MQMAKKSLFAVLLRSPWWVSALIAVVVGLLGFALLPETLRVGGALSGLPFIVIAGIAAVRQWPLPSAARVDETRVAVASMPWPAFAALLEQAFRRDGYSVERRQTGGVDFVLERKGRSTLVCARRWKSAHVGLEALRVLQAARDAAEATDTLYIGLGTVSDNAVPFAAEHRIAVWQAAELAHALRGLPLGVAKPAEAWWKR